eukprot:9171920-Pyramimonas_sp.AAC.2
MGRILDELAHELEIQNLLKGLSHDVVGETAGPSHGPRYNDFAISKPCHSGTNRRSFNLYSASSASVNAPSSGASLHF